MKKSKWVLSIFLALTIICGILLIAPVTVSAAGNSFSSATSYSLGSTVYGSISTSNTADYYKFTLSSSGRINLIANSYMRWIYYYIYDTNNNQVKYWNPSSDSTTNIASTNKTIDLVSGTYYFVVKKDGSNTGNYNFKLNFSSANESFSESLYSNNNDYSRAKSISLNTKYNGQIAENDNVDYYKLTLLSSGRINLIANSYMRWIYYYIYDTNNNQVKYWNPSSDSTTNIASTNKTIDLVSGTYYFVVKKDGSNTGNYNFKLNFSSANESFSESLNSNNNDYSRAKSISLNTKYNGQIAENDNVDYYKFTLSNSGDINLIANSYMNWIYYYIYDTSNNQIKSWNPRWNSDTNIASLNETIKLSSGTYYFVVAKDGSNTGNYNFSLTRQLPAPTSVKLNRGTLGLGVGESYGLVKTVSPSSANQSVTWSSSNSSVASVSSTGNVTGKRAGTATVTVRTSNGKTAICKVTVKAAPTSVKTNPTSLKLGVGETFTISESTNSGSYANAANLRWSSSNTSVATIAKTAGTNKAVITAKKAGITNITIKTYNGKTYTCTLTVYAAPLSVTLSKTSITLKKGQSYTISETTRQGSYANAANLKWSSTNTKVATVTKGSANKATIKAVGKGTAYIKITLYNGKNAQCKVTVQ